MITLIVILLKLVVGWAFVARSSGLHPLALISRVAASDSIIVGVYSFYWTTFILVVRDGLEPSLHHHSSDCSSN